MAIHGQEECRTSVEAVQKGKRRPEQKYEKALDQMPAVWYITIALGQCESRGFFVIAHAVRHPLRILPGARAAGSALVALRQA